MKGLLITIGVVAAGVAAYVIINKRKKSSFAEKCTKNGGTLTGETSCDFMNCDENKYSCDFYG